MSTQTPIIFTKELEERMQPWIEYLIENRNNPNKLNSCLDVASDNIRMLEALINCAEGYVRDFKMLKRIILSKNKDIIGAVISVDELEK